MDFELQDYLNYNETLNDPVLYRLTDRGLYSEVINLLDAIIYCLHLKRKLIVDDSEFQGLTWADLYSARLPSAKVSDAEINPDWIIDGVRSNNFGTIRVTVNDLWERNAGIVVTPLKIVSNIFELRRHLSSVFCVPKRFGMFARSWDRAKSWSMTPQRMAGKLRLEFRDFAAIHIRRGDKVDGEGNVDENGRLIVEGEDTPIEEYARLLKACSQKSVFVITDDYEAFRKLSLLLPDRKLSSLCSPEERGYRNREFQEIPQREKLRRLRSLVSSVELARFSQYFLGPYKSNLSRYIANTHCKPNACLSVDSQKVWTAI